MPKPSKRDAERYRKLRSLCEGLPEVSSEPYGDHTKFVVRKKTFAYYLNNHHNDGIVAVCCKNTPDEQRRLISLVPELYLVPAYLGPSGWVSLRMDLLKIDWDEVSELVLAAYRLQAPKRLVEGMG